MQRRIPRSHGAPFFACLLTTLISVVFSTVISLPAMAAPENKFIPVAGISGAARSAMPARFGPEVAILYGSDVDAVVGAGMVAGVADPFAGEYYAGPAFGLFYLGSFWLEGAAHWKKGQVTSYRATAAAGLFVFLPFVSLGYDRERESAFVEGGLMVKVPRN